MPGTSDGLSQNEELTSKKKLHEDAGTVDS